MLSKSHEVYYVYIGTKIPGYVKPSIRLANRLSGLKINLIGNSNIKKALKNLNVNFIELEDFYDKKVFVAASKNITFSHNFWDGFWLKTLERFFVLEQYMRISGNSSIFHSELDQILFRCDELLTNLEKSKKVGIFLPFVSPSKAVASIFWCNNYIDLKDLIDFASAEVKFSNEMELIAEWSLNNTNKVFGLPTYSNELNRNNLKSIFPYLVLEKEKISGVVDAAEIGQWFAGNDPRNIRISEKPTTKFIADDNFYKIDPSLYRNLQFKFDNEDRLFISNPELKFETQLFNLHIHSKIHAWILRFNNPKRRILELGNNPSQVKVFDARIIQFKHYFSESLFQVKNYPEKIFKVLYDRIFLTFKK